MICANAQTSRELHVEGILKVEKTGYHNPPKLEIQVPRNTKFSTRRTNREDTNDVWWQYKIWLLNGYRVIYAGKFAAIPFSSEPGVIYTDNSLEFTKVCEDLS